MVLLGRGSKFQAIITTLIGPTLLCTLWNNVLFVEKIEHLPTRIGMFSRSHFEFLCSYDYKAVKLFVKGKCWRQQSAAVSGSIDSFC